jgi:hypothetical protein
MPVIPEVRRMTQKDHKIEDSELKASMCYTSKKITRPSKKQMVRSILKGKNGETDMK